MKLNRVETHFVDLIAEHMNELHMEEVPASLIAKSQSSGLRHRREGTAYRLYLKDKQGEWRPTKRVKATDKLPRWRKAVYRGRMVLVEQSFKAFHAAMKSPEGMKKFNEYMKPYLKEYKKADNPLHRQAGRKIKRVIKRIFSK